MKKLLICMFAILFVFDIAAQEAKDYDSLWKKISQERVEVYFTFEKPDDLKIASISRIISIDQIRSDQVTAYANKASFKAFLKLGIPYHIQTPPGLQLKNPVMKGETEIKDLKDWNFYPTYEAYVAIMEQFESDYPDLCRLTNLGTLPSGRKILALMITDNVTQNEPEPEFFYTSSMHGDELTGYVLMLRLIDHLLSNYGSDPDITQLVNDVEIWINPLANPDGTYAGGNQTVQGATRGNANGIDINRNFPDPEDGPHPDGNDWQPETVIFMNFAEFHDFVMSCNLHGGAEVCNYPWDTWAQLHADDDWWQFVCREYADTVHAYGPPGYLTDLNNGITNGYAWYTISGGRQDYMNYFHSCREYTLEISSVKTPPASQLPDYWDYNYRSLLNYIKQSLYGVRGIVTDSITGNKIRARVYAEDHDIDSSWVYSSVQTGNYHRPVYSGTYDLTFSAPGYFPKTFENVNAGNYQTTHLNVELAPGTLIADFTADKTIIPTGAEVNFTDETYGDPVGWEWTFEGGSPLTSVEQHPEGILYEEVGAFTVSLKVYNEEGDTNIISKENYIYADHHYPMDNAAYTTCSGLFTDAAGMEENYGNNEDYIMTFSPDGNYLLMAEFLEFELEYEPSCNYDWLKIYDGPDTDAPLIGKYCGGDIPDTILAGNEFGALTFQFHSDQAETAPGWVARLSCDTSVGFASLESNVASFNLYPNPVVDDVLYLESNGDYSLILIYNAAGYCVHSIESSPLPGIIDLSSFKPGLYYVKLIGDKSAAGAKLIVM